MFSFVMLRTNTCLTSMLESQFEANSTGFATYMPFLHGIPLVPLSIQEYKWVPANSMLRVILWWVVCRLYLTYTFCYLGMAQLMWLVRGILVLLRNGNGWVFSQRPHDAKVIWKRSFFVRLGVPSTLVRHENEAFRKRSSNRRNLKTPAFSFLCGRRTCWKGRFSKAMASL